MDSQNIAETPSSSNMVPTAGFDRIRPRRMPPGPRVRAMPTHAKICPWARLRTGCYCISRRETSELSAGVDSDLSGRNAFHDFILLSGVELQAFSSSWYRDSSARCLHGRTQDSGTPLEALRYASDPHHARLRTELSPQVSSKRTKKSTLSMPTGRALLCRCSGEGSGGKGHFQSRGRFLQPHRLAMPDALVGQDGSYESVRTEADIG
ncbi:hypothetical protein M440DRAFT_1390669 [Trichoderma longibrachiatum ATCC 18648]|uniref:Uncharacterized protein n=1 Tax=Trichoderma longibrachiatum ATCC 18648 TaxID=983965 RepID=A0A2T4C725_TRILO|nr:hypothetical protein M440DRAFT_1390669 [Trichoderma longibrachiatum ATCC 18648]